MKLNVGCGGIYKKNYVNIDAFDSTVADKKMLAIDLKYNDNSIEEIIASQVIEHLGLVESIYALSEWYRVLQPDGSLVIETPDLKNAFHKYVKSNREDRKELLPWIYGLDTPGLLHKSCYPDDLLEEILLKIGFKNIEKEFYELDKNQPILKIVCIKSGHTHYFQVISNFRKQLIKRKSVNIHDQVHALAQEELIDFFSQILAHSKGGINSQVLEEITVNGAVISPDMTQIFLETLIEKGVISKETGVSYLTTIKTLIKVKFLHSLCLSFRETSGFVGEQKKLFQIIKGFAKTTVRNLLDSTKT
jgi:hypothetical protein